MQLELYDVIFFIRSLKGPTDAFNIYDHVTTDASIQLQISPALLHTSYYEQFKDIEVWFQAESLHSSTVAYLLELYI